MDGLTSDSAAVYFFDKKNIMQIDFQKINIGDTLPILVKEPISRTTLALFGGASHDHNPIHIDIDFAKKAGYKDVFAHGMLGMAYLGQVLTNWIHPTAIKSFSTRFKAITHIRDVLTCSAKVEEKIVAVSYTHLTLPTILLM